MIAPDGLKLIYTTTIIFLVLLIITYFFPITTLKIITTVIGVIFLFNFFFLRDPERNIPQGNHLILSPADGTVIKIEEAEEPYFFKQKVKKVSIFLSVFNVHVNRIPVSGKVEFFKYIEGKFFAAFEDKASENNEQTVIGINNTKGKILFKQIAGIIARRIVCTISEGDSVKAGDRCGLIRYGSRVDMFFPQNVELKIKIGEKVTGGESIIGEFQ